MALNGHYAGGFAEGMVAADDMVQRRRQIGLQGREVALRERLGEAEIERGRQELISKAVQNIETFAQAQIAAVQKKADAMAAMGDVAGARDFVARAAPVVGAAIDKYSERLKPYGVTLPSYQPMIAGIVVKDPMAIASTEGRAAGTKATSEVGAIAEATGADPGNVARAKGLRTPTLEEIGTEAEAARPTLGRVAAEANIQAAASAAHRAPPEPKVRTKDQLVTELLDKKAQGIPLTPGEESALNIATRASVLEQLLMGSGGLNIGGAPNDGRGPQKPAGAAPAEPAGAPKEERSAGDEKKRTEMLDAAVKNYTGQPEETILQQARDAIAQGVAKDFVVDFLKRLGVEPTKL